MVSTDLPSTRGTMRFSLRSLLLFVALIAAPLSVCRWHMVLGLSLTVVVAGVICAVIGVRTSRRGTTIFGVLLVLGAVGFIRSSASQIIAWVGSCKLDVYVLVLDSSSLAPISGAKIELLYGPQSPWEGPTPNVEMDFEIDEIAGVTQPLIAGALGRTEFTHDFRAAGSDGMFRSSGYVDTTRSWLRVTAPGYVTTLMPMDGHSIHPRDIHDKTPLIVTVPMGKR